jgi:elongation of very long chain fatty acids protein 4
LLPLPPPPLTDRRGLLIYGNICYFSTLALLYLWMRDREAYNPRLFMQFYNLSCVLLAGISGVCILLYKVSHTGGKFVCNPRGGQLNDTADGLLQWGFWFFYHQKYWEFLDTFIFMLRKSYRQVSFLHVFHHSSITIVTAIAVQFDSSGDTYLASLLNSWVHVLMCACCATPPRPDDIEHA